MKWLFFAMCMICAVALSMLSYAAASGKVPFFPVPEVVGKPHGKQAMEKVMPLGDPSGASGVVEMEKSLKEQTELYEKKLASLDERDKELTRRKQIVEEMERKVREVQDKLDGRLVEIDKTEAANIKKLAEIFSKMEPENAASLLMDLERERAARIISMISGRQAAAIFGAAVSTGAKGAKAAADWSDIVRRLQKESETSRKQG